MARAEILFEATASSVGDVDEAGKSLVVLTDAVELRERDGQVVVRVPIGDVRTVDIRRRLASTTVVVVADDHDPLELRGLRPALARDLRDAIAALLVPEHRDGAATPTVEALRRLDDLARKGLLSDKELIQRRSQLARRR
jgi:hypothetical protein